MPTATEMADRRSMAALDFCFAVCNIFLPDN
jgi:hypothetical protein